MSRSSEPVQHNSRGDPHVIERQGRKPIPFTQGFVKRLVDGARAGGVKIGKIEATQDGTITIYDSDLVAVEEEKEENPWLRHLK